MKMVVCSEITDEGSKSLQRLADFLGQQHMSPSELHFVHVFETKVFANDFTITVYPTTEQFPEIDEAVIRTLKSKSQEVLKKLKNPPKTFYKCLHSTNSKEETVQYLRETNADIVVVLTRGLSGVKGFFSSSFADFLVRHAPCNVLVVRP